MLPEMSTQNSILVSRRRVFGSLRMTGPQSTAITTMASNTGKDSLIETSTHHRRPDRPTA